MANEIFFGWLGRLVNYLRRTVGLKILWLVGNCSARSKTEKFSALQNVCIEFLPLNTMSKVQHLDVGIIA